MAGYVARVGRMRNADMVFFEGGGSENLKQRCHLWDLGFDRRADFSIDFKNVRYENVDCVHAAQERAQWRPF